MLGGLYLTPLDRAMEDLCKKNWIRYQRFMDDYVIFAKTCHKLKAAIKRMSAVLDTPQLTAHPDKRYIRKLKRGSTFWAIGSGRKSYWNLLYKASPD